MKEQGQFKQADFFENVGGLNLRDTPFRVKDSQATGGLNYDYLQTGGIRKRFGHSKINSSADTQTTSLGLALYNSATSSKFLVRAAGTKLQNLDIATPAFTNLSEDTTTAGTNFLSGSSSQPVVFSQFNTANANILWNVGGGMSAIYGVYSSSKVTQNGVVAPTTSSFTATAGAGSSSLSTGTYRYTLVYRKTSTVANSNASTSTEASVSVTAGQNVTLAWTLSNNDTTKFDQIWVYRSALNGSAAFTTGDLVTQLSSSATGYTDTGTSTLSSQNVPRAGSTILDNSPPTSGTPTTLTTWKRRLVTAIGSTIYLSDLNKPESWPTVNTITVPSGGNITGLAVVGFSTINTNNEYLAIFKERELWILSGDSISDWSLDFVDAVGCANQSLIVSANGFLAFIDYRGIYLWDGSNKPIYSSGPIETLFGPQGDIDKQYLARGVGTFSRKQNQIIWAVPHITYGINKFQIKLDLRLTLPSVETSLYGRNLDGVFSLDSTSFSVYAMLSYLPSSTFLEKILLGDSSGYVYDAYSTHSDASSAFSFQYLSRFMDMGDPNVSKRFHKVIVWVEEVGDWKLYLDYWSGYRSDLGSNNTLAQQMSTSQSNATALWDIAAWDSAYWDAYQTKYRPLVFNLNPGFNNASEGDALRIRFRQEDANAPVTIAGFSVIYSEKSLDK
jgi:hypothetical protein